MNANISYGRICHGFLLGFLRLSYRRLRAEPGRPARLHLLGLLTNIIELRRFPLRRQPVVDNDELALVVASLDTIRADVLSTDFDQEFLLSHRALSTAVAPGCG
jgi:hypothetical protein